MSIEAMRVSVEAVRVSIEALRCFRGRERLEEVPENVNCGHESVISRPLLTLSQPLKHSQGLCSESVVEAVRVLHTHSSATVS